MCFIIGGLLFGGGALLSAGASAIGSEAQAGAAENAQGISQGEFNTITQQETPYMQGGYGALSQLDYLLGVNPETNQQATIGGNAGAAGGTPSGVGWSAGMGPTGGNALSALSGATPTSGQQAPPGQSSTAGGFGSLLTPFNASYMQQYSPAYQFQLQQGQQGTLNQDAGAQGALSGAALKDLTSFNQNFANTAYNNAFNQYQAQQGNTYSRLAGIAQLGQASTANTGQQGTALAGQAAQSATNVGTAIGGGIVGAGNALGQGGTNYALLSALQAGNQPSQASIYAS